MTHIRKTSCPNILFVFADQWRAQAAGFAGDPNARTPNLDSLAERSIQFTHAVANCPVCSPWRATLMTGQYPLTHGVFVNDVPVSGTPRYLAECFRDAGYDTAYIGKWHIDGHGRSAYIPPERRKGFGYWKAWECTHDYNRSFYHADRPERLQWEGYDAIAQTRDAIRYLERTDPDRPFFLMLSWGPPHDPYHTAPERFRRLFDPERISLRPNVPAEIAERARSCLAGYYAHCAALDECVGAVVKALDRLRYTERTMMVFTSDHGDMVGSQGAMNKQRPWDESILVPMLLRCPALFGPYGRTVVEPFNAPHLMPTLLGLAGLPIPQTVEGKDYGPFLFGKEKAPEREALIELPACFHQYAYYAGGRDWRGLRSVNHTYVIDRDGPWMLFDNAADPFQLVNVARKPEYRTVEEDVHRELTRRLRQRGDEFLHGSEYIRRAGYAVDDRGDPVYQR